MAFNSLQFILFLPVVFALYWYVFKKLPVQNWFLAVASVLFYACWDWRFAFLLVLTTLSSYAAGLALERVEKRKLRAWISAANIVANLLILGFFKYYNFFAESFADLLRLMGFLPDFATLNIVLPVGISFYTFQALSYSIDVYRRKLPATHRLDAFMAYVTFFPQLVAGPIERASNLLPQMLRQRSFDFERAADGCRQMLWGFVKKIVVADNCAVAVDMIWGNYTTMSGLQLLIGAVLFAIQIYADFSAYSDIAIGCARLFGIELQINFKYPYFSRNVGEFWRRWHMSLMRWFKQYVYIPLGGNRRSLNRTLFNIMIVFLLSGLWHGANWTYVVWGAYHGLLMCIALLMGWNRHYTSVVAAQEWVVKPRELCNMALTFALVVLGWIFFRSNSMAEAEGYLSHMISHIGETTVTVGYRAMFYSALLLLVDWVCRRREHVLRLNFGGLFQYRWGRWVLYYGLVFLIIYELHQSQQSFIYFQF
jgi:D-alanyl-lipoteichoic acid acyltransferase DltB (MBOAT superfamily)